MTLPTWERCLKLFIPLPSFHFKIIKLGPPLCQKIFSLYHLARADVIFAKPGLQVIVKWTKTIQDRKSVKILKIPALGSNLIVQLLPSKIYLKLPLDLTTLPCFSIKPQPNGFPLQITRSGAISNHYFANLICKIPVSHSTPSAVQVSLSPLI